MADFGISDSGRTAEERFRGLTGAIPASRASDGDALLEGHPVEVKRATSNTLNQVRAVKYIPIVALFAPTDTWYVVPAHEVVVQVSRKARGQHTENPFESATLSLGNLGAFRVDDPQELRLRTLQAIEASASYLILKKEMLQVLAESKALAASSTDRVRALIDTLGLDRSTSHHRRNAAKASVALKDYLARRD